jgi:hypothetical protein
MFQPTQSKLVSGFKMIQDASHIFSAYGVLDTPTTPQLVPLVR